MIYVFYATKVNIGGWATFTRHLVDLLTAHGEQVELVKLGNNYEHFTRPFGPAHSYRNVTMTELVRWSKNNPIIIAALGKHYVGDAEILIRLGAGVVVHDTAESTNRMDVARPWVIRKALAPLFPGSVFIRHPYIRHSRPAEALKPRKAILATSRVDFDKNTAMILDANRLGANIEITGFENRLYTRFKICPTYPEWVQSKGDHPRTGASSFARLLSARAMVDLTDIKGDGGGTQYTFLEAWDAGAAPIIGDWWIQKGDDMKPDVNCFTVGDARELAKLAKNIRSRYYDSLVHEIRVQGEKALRRHTPKVLGPQIMEWINAR